MLHNEWPRGGSEEAYRDKLVHTAGQGASDASYALPCSYVLVVDDECVG
jgi:hypothetical protein